MTKKFCHRKFSQKNPKTEFSLQKASKRSSTKPFKKKCTYRTIAKSKSIQDLQQKLSKRIPIIYHTIYKKTKKNSVKKFYQKILPQENFPPKSQNWKKNFHFKKHPKDLQQNSSKRTKYNAQSTKKIKKNQLMQPPQLTWKSSFLKQS